MRNNHKTVQCKNYYGAANTANGFHSLFGSIFSPEKLKNIYILKGGPGCGKSTTIRRISEKALDKGYSVENYFCSSSPLSFDGVIIPELSAAVLDGTAPHTVDPIYPAVCENIINLGIAWDTNKATELDEQIRLLSAEKKAAYYKAYAYLSSCKSAQDVINSLHEKYLMSEKLIKAVNRLCSKLKSERGCGKQTYIYTDCISGIGNNHLDTFERLSETKYFVKDHAGLSAAFFDRLISELKRREIDITVSVSPLNPTVYNGVYIDDASISFTMYDDQYSLALDRRSIPYKIINTARFCDCDAFKRNKPFYKYANKASSILMTGAVTQLALAGKTHDNMEALYHQITDFDKVEEIAQELQNRIFG